MGKIGKISPIKKQYSIENNQQTLASSLASAGHTMYPGVSQGFVPYKERNNDYRTGLDPDAIYIKRMSEDEAKIERERVTALRDYLQDITGLDLGPRSEYYQKMFQPGEFGESTAAAYVKLYDQANTFNLDDPQSAITFAWLRVHPEIAPSYAAWERGISSHRCPKMSECKFFVDDIEYESEVAYRKKSSVNKAINSLENMSPSRQLKVAKLLGLPVTYNSKPEIIYNTLDNYIKESSESVRKSSNVLNFEKISQMEDENLELRFKIKEAIDLNVYRVAKAGRIMEGENKMADSEDELIEFFSNPKNQEDYLALKKKIDNAKIIEL